MQKYVVKKPDHPHWLETCSGRIVDLIEPRAESISLGDISWHLARQPRFNGAIPYSVADHSVWVAEYVYQRTGNAEFALQGLLHDAHEAYTGDIITPMKCLPEIRDGILQLQARLQAAICSAFALPRSLPVVVDIADRQALMAEAAMFMPSMGAWIPAGLDQFAKALHPPRAREPVESVRRFEASYERLRRIRAELPTTAADAMEKTA